MQVFLLEHRFDSSLVISSLHGTNDFIAVHFPILQEDHGRQTEDFIFLRKLLFLIEINFQDDRPAGILLGQILKDRRELFAGISPIRVKVKK